MKEIDNFVVVDKRKLKDKIDKLKLVRDSAMQDGTLETAQWLQGSIDSIKFVLSESLEIKDMLTDAFDKGWEKCGKYNANYNVSLEEYLNQVKITQQV